MMKQIFTLSILSATLLSACSSSTTNIFGKKTPLEKYEEKMEDSGLQKTPQGRLWLAASEKAVKQPVAIQLPYRHAGIFSSVKPQAIGLSFAAKQGQRLSFHLDKADTANFVFMPSCIGKMPMVTPLCYSRLIPT
jgi:hypothetical protein